MSSSNIIPIALTFDNNYVIPAGVAMYSLLENSSPNYIYEFNIIHHGITISNQKKLIENINKFTNQKIKFIYSNISFEKIFSGIKEKQHFSQEMFYKLILPSLFSYYEKIIVSDVDVVFCGDISSVFVDFNNNNYLGAVRHYSADLKKHLQLIYSKYPLLYQERINNFGAGFLLYNLKKMREDNIEQKMIKFLNTNIEQLIYPEQEVLNYVCSPKTQYISIKYMVVPKWINNDIVNKKIRNKYYHPYTKKEVLDAVSHPIQLHYASRIKPWNDYNCDNFDIWFQFLSKTIFLKSYLQSLTKNHNFKLYQDIANYSKNRFNYYRCKLLSNLTFGNMRRHYKDKKKKLKAKIKEVRRFLKGK